MHKKKIMIISGGTGGHIFPGLAIADYLRVLNWEVLWLGTSERMESYLVPKHDIQIQFIHIRGLRGHSVFTAFTLPMRIFCAWRQARKVIKSWSPDVVLGMGGYVSGPGGLAALSCGVPLILHEQNSIAGLTNKWLAKIASKVIQAFPGAFPAAEVVGNPVRMDLLALPAPSVRFSGRQGPIRVLVLGGSQGSKILNQTMPQVAEKLGQTIELWHQVGKGKLNAVCDQYHNINYKYYKVSEFIDDIANAYSWADIAVCRSGAMTVSELAIVGLPAIFIPFQHKDRHQYWNALQLVTVGGAIICEQKQFNADIMVKTLSILDRQILLKMANQTRSMAIPNATERVSAIIQNTVR
ncbi:UDP-N-acetylglucosamine--N-acetylmuramyl-(pentapeptide) pyrophosphoryl-undecaprenol N-acetylglucosamine transferase [Candidatus Erwinia haradaeae]|uniref:UDP-N-acetylglucosamine--N-acetylmuramyl-(pentapeptide) pyrophosphoryl-undecaprenol N-acetylglucosamine transferase n=1 Tax=Candidatus Erwinia haradaeae TaxID=1922217 RepID=A0A451DCX8_9GAMM|nr:UDP-N-acetylglucosamine--N-acetylmuramyl-(pentapeptide) pyrophosphoryl-undecaprenol N-acetylglucosamine transferase [Candidatus Erwinia haradaeae]